MRRDDKGPTSQFVHDVEGPKHKKRRERAKILKKEFRTVAERAAERIFGSKSEQLIVMRNKDVDNTEKVIRSVMGISKPLDFNRMLENFFVEIKLESGRLENPMAIWGFIAANDDRTFRERATIATIEVLMATEDESIAKVMLQRMVETDKTTNMQMLEGIIDFANIEYIHTVATFAEAFIRKPAEAAEQITMMARRTKTEPVLPGGERISLPNDFILSGIVKSNLGF